MEKGPQALRDILTQLFIARGWGRQQERLQLEQAWAEAMIENWERGTRNAERQSDSAKSAGRSKLTRVGGMRRGVLEIIVGSPVLLQELTHFHKRRLLEELKRRLPGVTLTDLRFRAGVVNE